MFYVELYYAATLYPRTDYKLAELAEQFQGKMGKAGLRSGSRVLNFEFENRAGAKLFAAVAGVVAGVKDVMVISGQRQTGELE